jgi:sugar lactone lactonase YvrE
MEQKQLLSVDGEHTMVVADLSALAAGVCNDIVTSEQGYSYVGNFGFNDGEDPVATKLIGVDSEGNSRHVADDIMFPNGSVITDQGRTLIVAETLACCLTAFDIGADGSLSNRRIWADLNGIMPDGICIDSQQGIWLATVDTFVMRVVEGGEVTDRINLSQQSFACVLDADEEYLYLCTSADIDEAACQRNRSGRIERIKL